MAWRPPELDLPESHRLGSEEWCRGQPLSVLSDLIVSKRTDDGVKRAALTELQLRQLRSWR